MAAICFIVCYSNGVTVRGVITMFKSQIHSIGKWASNHSIRHLLSVANLILLGQQDAIETKTSEGPSKEKHFLVQLGRNLPAALLLIVMVGIPFPLLNCCVSY